MPIYEYYCPQNHKIYSFLAPSLSYRNKVPACPDNAKFVLEKRVSRFAITGKAKEEDDDPFADVDDSKLDALLANMESEMEGMDTDNPDPRHLGQMMRKMGDALGKDLPPAFKEMISQLEKGADPDALEEQFGDQFDEDDMDFPSTVKKLLRRRAPIRDPKLYDMREYLAE